MYLQEVVKEVEKDNGGRMIDIQSSVYMEKCVFEPVCVCMHMCGEGICGAENHKEKELEKPVSLE